MASRTGATSGAQLVSVADIRGLKDFRRELKALGPEWPKELRKVHKTLATREAERAQGTARGMGGVQRFAAGKIRGTANQREARIGVSGGVGNVAFWGAKRHSGWYARSRYADSPPQHPPWVGNTWDVAVAGQGPYAINETLARDKDRIVDEYGDMVMELAKRAFPDGGH